MTADCKCTVSQCINTRQAFCSNWQAATNIQIQHDAARISKKVRFYFHLRSCSTHTQPQQKQMTNAASKLSSHYHYPKQTALLENIFIFQAVFPKPQTRRFPSINTHTMKCEVGTLFSNSKIESSAPHVRLISRVSPAAANGAAGDCRPYVDSLARASSHDKRKRASTRSAAGGGGRERPGPAEQRQASR